MPPPDDLKMRDPDGRLRINAGGTLYTDRPIAFAPSGAAPDGYIYVFHPGAWACPSYKCTPAEARRHAAALLAAAVAIEADS